MLIKCSECQHDVSDKAVFCPNCGIPILRVSKILKSTQKPKRKRLPNGFGQISEIKGQGLKKPFRAMKTTGFDEKGKPICKLLKPKAYFKSYNEAYAALLNASTLISEEKERITVSELYERWSNVYFQKISLEAQNTFRTSWEFCSSTKDILVDELKVKHIIYCMENGTRESRGKTISVSNTMQIRIKMLFNCMLDYAVQCEYTDRNCSRELIQLKNVATPEKLHENKHRSLTDEELTLIWKNKDKEFSRILLIQCYTGVRPKELCYIEIKNVDLKNRLIVCGMKTKAGTNRTVPIHPLIYPMICDFYKDANLKGRETLLSFGKNLKPEYHQYKYRMQKYENEVGLDPTITLHNLRKTFITLAKRYEVDEYAIKRIVGHAINDVTESVYTERKIDWLFKEIEKIKGPAF